MKQITLYLLLALLSSCKTIDVRNSEEEVKQLSEEVRQIYVPDSRVGVFDINFIVSATRK